MATMIWVFDIVLGLGLLGLAWAIVNARNIYQAVVMFIVFGLLIALSWARLQATDIALAEAAIGAGITGALFLSTIGRIRAIQRDRGEDEKPGIEEIP